MVSEGVVAAVVQALGCVLVASRGRLLRGGIAAMPFVSVHGLRGYAGRPGRVPSRPSLKPRAPLAVQPRPVPLELRSVALDARVSTLKLREFRIPALFPELSASIVALGGLLMELASPLVDLRILLHSPEPYSDAAFR